MRAHECSLPADRLTRTTAPRPRLNDPTPPLVTLAVVVGVEIVAPTLRFLGHRHGFHRGLIQNVTEERPVLAFQMEFRLLHE